MAEEVRASHYNEGIKVVHWDIVLLLGMDYYVGNTTRYLVRYGKKHEDPTIDLKKSISYLEKRIELDKICPNLTINNYNIPTEEAQRLVRLFLEQYKSLPKHLYAALVILTLNDLSLEELQNAITEIEHFIVEYESGATKAYVNQD